MPCHGCGCAGAVGLAVPMPWGRRSCTARLGRCRIRWLGCRARHCLARQSFLPAAPGTGTGFPGSAAWWHVGQDVAAPPGTGCSCPCCLPGSCRGSGSAGAAGRGVCHGHRSGAAWCWLPSAGPRCPHAVRGQLGLEALPGQAGGSLPTGTRCGGRVAAACAARGGRGAEHPGCRLCRGSRLCPRSPARRAGCASTSCRTCRSPSTT